jgi:YVTN family beta-propeller protein
VESAPSGANFHSVFSISNNVPNGIGPNVASYPGAAMQIDVSGDTVIASTSLTATGEPNTGLNPTHIAFTPTNERVFVASASSAFSGGTDVVASFSPVFQSSLGSSFGPVSTVALPTQAVTIASITEAGNVVTATLASPLLANPSNSASGPIAAGTTIVISGVLIPGCSSPCNPLLYNGTFTPTSITNNGSTITVVNANTGLAPASGGSASVPPQPIFLNSTQANAMYVANFNSNSVSAINTTTEFVNNSANVGVNPVGLAETPSITNNGAQKLYVANQGTATVNGSITSLNVTDLSSNAVTGFTGINPVWIVARGDSQKVYVLTQGDGKLSTIDTSTDTVTSPDCSATPSLCVGAGANFIYYDSHINRLYVTNPVTGLLYIFSDTGGPNDTPSPLTPGGITIPALPTSGATFSCSTCSAPVPVSVTALPDGSAFYVASYQTSPAPCPDPNVSGACVIPELTGFDANSLTATTAAMTLLTWAPAGTTTGPFATNQFAVPPVATCVPASLTALVSPTTTRFRMFTATAADSSSVYVSSCDAGVIAAINTTDNNANGAGGSGTPANTLVTDLPTPFSNGAIQANGEPPNQNPLFLLTGQ